MNPHFDFVVDKEKKAIYITREFAADRDIVWDAFTKAEILVRWIAPKPMKAFIKEMDFREGGLVGHARNERARDQMDHGVGEP